MATGTLNYKTAAFFPIPPSIAHPALQADPATPLRNIVEVRDRRLDLACPGRER